MLLTLAGIVGVVVGLLAVAALTDLVGAVVAQRSRSGVRRALADLQVAAGLRCLGRVVLRVRRRVAAATHRADRPRVRRVVGLLAGEAAGLRAALLVTRAGVLRQARDLLA